MNRLRRPAKKIAITLGVVCVLLGVFLYVWIWRDLPSLTQLQSGMVLPSTRIYDRNGLLLYEISAPNSGRNTALSLEQIPAHCQNAVIATEDANYWNHVGVDITGILRAVWINLQGGEVIAGGSTITQQTARLLLLDPQGLTERTLQRKLKEMVLAVQLQQITSKQDLLALYLNQVYFGNLAYGIEAAANTYFQKSASELSLSECAFLAGIVQNAFLYDPLTNQAQAKNRQQVVLNLMAQNGYITQSEADSAFADVLQIASTPFPIEAPHFVMAVLKQLERQYPDELYGAGLEVITTVDLNWQKKAQEVVQAQLYYLNNPTSPDVNPANANNAAVIALDPYTGEVYTMLGSPDYFDANIDGAVNAVLANRQPGSALKPFVYALAMLPDSENPYTGATMLLDVETPFVTRKLESYTPGNFALVEHGPVSARTALASSYNIPAVIALEKVGVQNFIAFANNIGLTNLTKNTNLDLSLALGGGEVRLLDLAQAYSIFPNGGYRVQPQMILQVRNHNGDVLFEYQSPRLTQQVLDERVAYLITDILSDNNARLPAFGINSPLQVGRPAAAKTGTTTDYRDNWVMGYTPNLVIGVWVGNADNTPMRDITGVSGAGPIYNSFLRNVLLGTPETPFTRPDGFVDISVCVPSGLLPTESCDVTRVETFINGTQPTQFDNLYQTVSINRRNGQLADDSTPRIDIVQKTYLVLPQEARDWGIRNGILPPPDGANILLPDADAPLRLLEPDPYTIFEVSPILPLSAQRLRLIVGTSPNTQSVAYWLNGKLLGTSTQAPWDVWWALEVGEHELMAIATLTDGTTLESPAIVFSVVTE
jgi:penicillin-binding protein 1C